MPQASFFEVAKEVMKNAQHTPVRLGTMSQFGCGCGCGFESTDKYLKNWCTASSNGLGSHDLFLKCNPIFFKKVSVLFNSIRDHKNNM